MKTETLLRKYVTFPSLFLLTSLLTASTVGKVSGTVVNESTGEGLAGANVIIDGTGRGASADEDGSYFILNVPAGSYSVTASYIGHESLKLTGLTVAVDKTTTANFSLKSGAVEGASVTVTAERPMIQKDLTATEQLLTSEDFDRRTVRTVTEAIETMAGVQNGHFRGGDLTQSVYVLDNVSLNTGVLSNNYTGINVSTIQEISVLTGGYNAEYGTAQSGIINVVTKNADPGIHGTVITRYRPAGVYHWGRNFYSKENYEWTNYATLANWEAEVANAESEHYGGNAAELLSTYEGQITANPDQGDYADRAETEVEATLFAGFGKVNAMVSGRFINGVNIYPQALPYNPATNFQLKLGYALSSAMEVELNSIIGSSQNSGRNQYDNFTTMENAQEGQWFSPPTITDPYNNEKYAIMGNGYYNPEEVAFSNHALNFTHTVNPKMFYELNFSMLNNQTDRLPPEGYEYLGVWDTSDPAAADWVNANTPRSLDNRFKLDGVMRTEDQIGVGINTIRGDVTNQVNSTNLVKAGVTYKMYDFFYKHSMSVYEGGERWNLMNIYDGKPTEGAAYIQDKIEFEGMIINVGLRADWFSQNRTVSANRYDPLAVFEGTEGWSGTVGIPGNPTQVETETQLAIAPRLGVSHPINDNAVLHFVYGHFYQRPSWTKIYGFSYINFSQEDLETIQDPYANTTTYMDQWQGWMGNPLLEYQQTIQYELGIDYNIADKYKIDATVYYKDAQNQTVSREANTFSQDYDTPPSYTTLYNADNPYNVPVMVSNMAYADARGAEVELSTYFSGPVNINAIYDITFVSGGVAGYESLFESPDEIPSRWGYSQTKKPWNTAHKFKFNGNLFLKKLDLNVNVYSIYNTGPEFTYHGPGDVSTQPFNERWNAFKQTNMKIAKGFTLGGMRAELSADIRNLLENKDLNTLSGDNLINYMEGGKKEDVLPTHSFSGEPNEWAWYNSYTNPRRMIYMQLKVDF